MTVDDVRNMVFSAPPVGKRGYNREDVDILLKRIEERLESRNQLSADDVRAAVFRKPPLFHRGYNEDEVDDFLDRAEATVRALESRGR
ncbi:MAG TPA: DivIVA domain-containing protein [Mycobacterium sp.]|nr:DivIVA domain-containing protein [Mycobacterium sp.]